jgi:hypothetical protein
MRIGLFRDGYDGLVLAKKKPAPNAFAVRSVFVDIFIGLCASSSEYIVQRIITNTDI